MLRLAKLLSLVRLLRLSRLVRYVSQWEEVYVSVWHRRLRVIQRFRIFGLRHSGAHFVKLSRLKVTKVRQYRCTLLSKIYH